MQYLTAMDNLSYTCHKRIPVDIFESYSSVFHALFGQLNPPWKYFY